MTDTTRAIIGLDGLDRADVVEFDVPGTWSSLSIDTVAHTCPSWNAIFSGIERDGVYDFFKIPDDPTASGKLAAESDEMWTYGELNTDAYLWNRCDIEVVSAPVSLPTFSTLDDPPGNDLTWCGTREEISRSIDVLTEKTLAQDQVITVFPFPDKMHHLVYAADSEYTKADRREQMRDVVDAVERITDAFDEWVILSDHGRPGPKEFVPIDRDLWVSAHNPTGVIRSNVRDTVGLTNVSVYHELAALLEDT